MAEKLGYRGYIASREVRGVVTPQQVQNLVIRDYAAKNKLLFLLSATEYSMPACYMMLDAVLSEVESLEGIICFSMFMLPKRNERRREIYQTVLNSGASLHSALEGIVLKTKNDIALFEDLFMVEQCCQQKSFL